MTEPTKKDEDLVTKVGQAEVGTTPPDTRAWGSSCLIRRVASMKSTA